jgi:hypothetical protein
MQCREQAAAGSTGTVTSGSKRAKPPGNFESYVVQNQIVTENQIVQNLYFNHTTVIYHNEHLKFFWVGQGCKFL